MRGWLRAHLPAFLVHSYLTAIDVDDTALERLPVLRPGQAQHACCDNALHAGTTPADSAQRKFTITRQTREARRTAALSTRLLGIYCRHHAHRSCLCHSVRRTDLVQHARVQAAGAPTSRSQALWVQARMQYAVRTGTTVARMLHLHARWCCLSGRLSTSCWLRFGRLSNEAATLCAVLRRVCFTWACQGPAGLIYIGRVQLALSES